MKLLLISNSTNVGEAYLEYPKNEINRFLGEIKQVLFIPYAAVTFSYDDYLTKVQGRLSEFGITVNSIHKLQNKQEAVLNAQAIVVGGGNTWKLLKTMQEYNLLETIKQQVTQKNIPYIGWSAGSNLACPTIKTTNDMPICQPQSFEAIGFIPFQINPHYLDAKPDGHAGETREQRIEEFIVENQNVYVVGLREGCMLKIIDKEIELIGERPMRIFKYDQAAMEYISGDKLDFLFC